MSSGDVYTEGISAVSSADIAYAREMGYAVKLLAIGEEIDGSINARVHPAMLACSHPLATVRNEFNAIFVEGDAIGEVMFYGPGAGRMPTASAVLGDVMEAARNLKAGMKLKVGCTCYDKKPLLAMDELSSRFYLLLKAKDKPGVLAQVSKVFGDNKVSLLSVLQQFRGEEADLVFITHEVSERSFFKSIGEIKELDVVSKVCSYLRVLD